MKTVKLNMNIIYIHRKNIFFSEKQINNIFSSLLLNVVCENEIEN